jgi:hypothetical protein
MPSSENALIQFENASPTLVDFVELTDQGDNKTFKSTHELWSKQQGMAPDVKPNGLATGGQVTPGSADDSVDVAALTCYLAGVLTSVSAASGEAVTRATTDTHIVNSVTITNAGAIAVLQGSEGTSFSETRGAAGGPPWIPTDSIEIAQVRLSEQSAAPVASSEIYSQEGLHKERFDSPMWDEVTAEVENMIQGYAGIRFYQALAEIHSDDSGSTTSTKKVFAKYSIPNFTDLAKGVDFKPPEVSHSVSSTQIYGMTLGSKSSSLNQGSFTAYLETNIKDELVKQKDKNLWFKFYPDRYSEGYILCQGFLGLDRNFPADSPMNASATISAEQKAMEVAG